ncbi:RVP_2 domain-containing protein [Cucumis melo var. makuwa]|uniref:RVP_2 domain-containing protein n=1 Tax=Cucumis melo var. makuwa TaxID=1194695 RepID=A0A5D3CU59_CUCMM|nr:RVP_2 domain-containing protein [Cucumis melo var. makuwa]TYK14748.1 RVP_2 domain-containing protein [Cucumis melo var. makuwa]
MFITTLNRMLVVYTHVSNALLICEVLWGCELSVKNVTVVFREMRKEKVKQEDVLVVNEFLYVFPEDLSKLPSDRKVEFTIELLPRSALIFQAP